MNKQISIILFSSLFLIKMPFSYGQERENKTIAIIDSLEIVEIYKMSFIDFRINLLKYEAVKEDSVKLIEIENLLTDAEIQRRIIQAFDEFFTDNEIDDLYTFVKTSVFQKFWVSSFAKDSIFNQFEDIAIELDRISQNIEKERDEYSIVFEPIPIDRINGFYATIDYIPYREDNEIVLENNPAITKKDILEIKKGVDNYGRVEINITLKNNATKKFYILTKNNIGKPIAIVIDRHIVSLPIIHSAISGKKISISVVDFTEEEIDNLIQKLRDE